MKTKKITFFIVITILSWLYLAQFMTTGESNPINFWEMSSGINKAVVAWIITLCSIAPVAIIIFMNHVVKRLQN